MMIFCLGLMGVHLTIGGTPTGLLLRQKVRRNRSQAPRGRTDVNYTTVLCRAMQVRSTSSIGLPHQSLEKISISE
ncbi:hypothetical protein ACVWY3_003878 [Bradyrhizobium sp. USDA 4486]